MKTFEFVDNVNKDILMFNRDEAIELESPNIKFKLTHKDTLNPQNSITIEDFVEDIDPEGQNSMDLFDPSGEYNEGKVYMKQGKDYKVTIFIPYHSDADYVGLELEYNKDNIIINDYQRMLILNH